MIVTRLFHVKDLYNHYICICRFFRILDFLNIYTFLNWTVFLTLHYLPLKPQITLMVSHGLATLSASHNLGFSVDLRICNSSSIFSVKIWLGHVERLMSSSKADDPPLSLFQQVTDETSVPVSIISLAVPLPFCDKVPLPFCDKVPLPFCDKVVLAIGRGSGSLEAFICYIPSNKVDSMGVCNAHNQAVGLLFMRLNQ